MKLSIITINRNNAAGLERTMRSVFCQTFSDYEYIIVDGASTDGSVGIIKQHADKIHKWVSEPDTGIYNAMNKGIRMAEGEYCYFLNSGDSIFAPDTLEQVFGKTEGAPDFIHGDIAVPRKGGGFWIWKGVPQPSFYEMYANGRVWHQAMFVRRGLFHERHFYDETCGMADTIFNVEMMIFNNVTSLYIPVVFAVFDQTGIGAGGRRQGADWSVKNGALGKFIPEGMMRDIKKIRPYEILLNREWDLQSPLLRGLHERLTVLSMKVLKKMEKTFFANAKKKEAAS
jgi:glycosyltransferase involved in cell wall biosynthesis